MSRRRERGASLPLEDSPTHCIQCGWLRRALPPRHAGQLLSGLTVDRILPRYTVKPHAPHPRRAHLRIKWIRWHGTFSSYRLRRKLHGPFSHEASYGKLRRKLRPCAVSTRQGMAMRDGRFPRVRKSRNEIFVACNAIISVQYVILYYIVGPTCRGLNGHVHASLEI